MTDRLTDRRTILEVLLFLLARIDQPSDQVITALMAGHLAEVKA